jgi:hypothetical protein
MYADFTIWNRYILGESCSTPHRSHRRVLYICVNHQELDPAQDLVTPIFEKKIA